MQINAKHYIQSLPKMYKNSTQYHANFFLICAKLMIVTSLSDQKFNINTCRTSKVGWDSEVQQDTTPSDFGIDHIRTLESHIYSIDTCTEHTRLYNYPRGDGITQ